MVCGSGLGGLSSILSNPVTVQYKEIPGFPSTTVQGHKGELVFGTVGASKTQVVCLRGRFHSYEGHDMAVTALPGKLFHLLGCEIMVVTNAAGGIRASFEIGDVMIITDHIGLPLIAGKHPLVGPNDASFGARFPAMSEAYDKDLRKLLLKIGKENKSKWLKNSGTYVMVSGPSYETAAESDMLRRIGADSVGMSTVPEVVSAVHCGLRVVGLSLITNKVALPNRIVQKATHEEVLGTVDMRGRDICTLVEAFLDRIDEKVTDSDLESSNILEDMKEIDLSNTTPLEALNLISTWQQALK